MLGDKSANGDAIRIFWREQQSVNKKDQTELYIMPSLFVFLFIILTVSKGFTVS